MAPMHPTCREQDCLGPGGPTVDTDNAVRQPSSNLTCPSGFLPSTIACSQDASAPPLDEEALTVSGLFVENSNRLENPVLVQDGSRFGPAPVAASMGTGGHLITRTGMSVALASARVCLGLTVQAFRVDMVAAIESASQPAKRCQNCSWCPPSLWSHTTRLTIRSDVRQIRIYSHFGQCSSPRRADAQHAETQRFAVLRLMLRASSHASRASGESSGESSARGPSGEQVDPLWAADPCALDGSLRRSKAQKRPFAAGAQAVLTQGGQSRAELLAEQLEGLFGYGSAAKRSGGSGERRQTQGK
ncbi:unnamed protein product, partial [Polarella glacialis]